MNSLARSLSRSRCEKNEPSLAVLAPSLTRTVTIGTRPVPRAPYAKTNVRGGAPGAPPAVRNADCGGTTILGNEVPKVGAKKLTEVVCSAAAAAGIARSRIINSPYGEAAASGDAVRLKELSRRSRTRWVSHLGTREDAQLSFVGRALPVAPRESCVAALRQHITDLTTPFTTPQEHLNACRAFVSSWARRKLFKVSAPLGLPDWPNNSACIESPLSKGGAYHWVLSQSAEYPLPFEFPFDGEGARAATDARLTGWALDQFRTARSQGFKGPDGSTLTASPPAKAVCLAERGLKTRVVTVSPSYLQTLGFCIGGRLRQALKRTPEAFAPLSGAKDEEILGHFTGCEATVISTDLTRASDLLPLDLCQAVVDGLEDSGRFSELELELLRVLTGPQHLFYPDLGVSRESCRGILMGLPTTWSILSLIHLYWVDVGRRASRLAVHSARTRGLICGDDALLALNGAGASAYAECVRACGGEVSAGKHYESREGPVRRAVFLERLFEFTVTGGKLGPGIRVPAIPLKGLTADVLPRSFSEGRNIRCHSPGIRMLVVLDSLWGQSPANHGPLRLFVKNMHPWLPKYASEVLELSPGLPLHLGGYCFGDPATLTEEQVSDAKKIQASGRSVLTSIKRDIDPLWRMASLDSQAGREWSQASGECIWYGPQPVGHLPPLPVPELGETWTLVDDDHRAVVTTTQMYRQYASFGMGRDRLKGGSGSLTLRATDFVRARKRSIAASPGESPWPLGTRMTPPLSAWRASDAGPADRRVYGVSWFESSHTSSCPLMARFWQERGFGGPSERFRFLGSGSGPSSSSA